MSGSDAVSGFRRSRSRTKTEAVSQSQIELDLGSLKACRSTVSGSSRLTSRSPFNPEASPPHAMPRPPLLDAPPAGEVSCGCSSDRFGLSGAADIASAPLPRRLTALRRIAGDKLPDCTADPPSGVDQDTPWPRWTSGADDVDRLLGPGGLASDGLHEIKPALAPTGGCHAGDWAAALAFGLRLALRRLSHAAQTDDGAVLLWCQPRQSARELGRLHAPGLKHLGIDPAKVILVETARREETLWAMEEGLASGVPALVAGIVDDVGLTPARRLSLRAQRQRIPCLLFTSAHSAATAATATRWRISRHPGAPHPFDPRAPGALRLAVALERCRQRPLLSASASFFLEWSDEAFRFDMAPGLADRADDPRERHRFVA